MVRVGFEDQLLPIDLESDFAVEDRSIRQAAKGRRKFWERFGDFVASPRVQARFAPADVCLRADAIVLVFDGCVFKIAQRFFARLNRARQHEINRVEDSHPRFREFARTSQQQSFANIAEQHVAAFHLVQRRVEALAMASSRDFLSDQCAGLR